MKNCAKIICLLLLSFGFFGSAENSQAAWVHEASGRTMTSFPMYENFNNAAAYWDEIVWWEDSIHSLIEHATNQGWQGSGAPKFTFTGGGQDNSGLGTIFLPSSPRTRKINVRWLVYYGPNYASTLVEGSKNLIVQRCNADCSGYGTSGQRGMVMETPGGQHEPYISENIELSGNEPREAGKAQFFISEHQGEWISYEAEFDLDASMAKLFIDTQDGEQNSNGGLAPYKTYTNWDTSNYWKEVGWLMGYWADRGVATADSYYIVDELAIDADYIGPPTGFNSADTTPPAAPSGLVIQ